MVRLAIIGTGNMAKMHAILFKGIPGCHLVAAVDTDKDRVTAFATEHGIPKVYTSTQELLARADIDAVSIVTPDRFHAEVSIECLQAGKHVLCEKPLAIDYPEAARMVIAAEKAGVVNMVNFSYRNFPCLQRVAELIGEGAIGEIRHVEASYLQAWLVSKVWGDWRTSPTWLWRLSSEHGSKGVLGDVGVHILDFATFPVGKLKRVYCRLQSFEKAPDNRIGEYHLDANDSAVMTVEFVNGALGTIHMSRWVAGHVNRQFLKISGTLGTVEIDSERSSQSYRIFTGEDLDTNEWHTVEVEPTPDNHTRFIESIQSGKQDPLDFARGAEIQKIIDACFESDERGMPVEL